MNNIILPIDIKSLYFNIKNDNASGHTATVASPLRKVEGENKLEDILKLTNCDVDISNKSDLVELLIKHSKSKVIIRKLYVFTKLMVNGRRINANASFGCYIKEEIDETKVQFGRLKLHYPSKLIYEDEELNINNRQVYKSISESLGGYAFVIRSFEYNPTDNTLNFDALIVGENDIPYSKVFIIEKGVGNKFNFIFNEIADDYDREIISLRKKYGEGVDPYNYLDYFKRMKKIALDKICPCIGTDIEIISENFPYSLFDFCYLDKGVKKYGILRVTATKNKYFNLSIYQQSFMQKNSDDVKVFLVSDIFEKPLVSTFKYDQLANLTASINSLKYEEE